MKDTHKTNYKKDEAYLCEVMRVSRDEVLVMADNFVDHCYCNQNVGLFDGSSLRLRSVSESSESVVKGKCASL